MNRRMLLGSVLLLSTTLLGGCSAETQTEASPLMRERATVVKKLTSPERHESRPELTGPLNAAPDVYATPVPGLSRISSNQLSREYAIILKCQHGEFIVRREDIYSQLAEGQTVEFTYREIYRATYGADPRTGQRGVIKRALVECDIVDIVPQ